MKTLIILLVVALAGIALGQQRRCPANMIQLFNGVSCSTDAMCYNMAPGYFCLNGYCCSNSASSPSGYGSSCTYQSQCSFANSQCLNNICYCAAGYDYDGYNCQSSGQTVSSPNVCGANEILINNQCYQNANYFGDCIYPQQCTSITGICRDNKCMCDTGFVYNGYQCISDQAWQSPSIYGGLNCNADQVPINNKCYPTRRRGQSCFYTEQCVLDGDGELECQNGICQDALINVPVGPGPVIYPPPLPQPPLIYPPSPQYPQPRPQYQPYPSPQYQPYPYQQPSPQITVITICCLRANSWPCCNCAINQVLINGRCYATSLPGGSCQYDQQCNDPLSKKQLYCGSGICRWVFSGNPTCRNPSSAIERINGVIKNCLYQDCSFGYQCEYNSFFNNGQYICCSSNGGGGNNGGNNGQPGQIKFYPGTSLPLECRAINACTFVDFPHCVYSQRYGYQVCCSTQYCY